MVLPNRSSRNKRIPEIEAKKTWCGKFFSLFFLLNYEKNSKSFPSYVPCLMMTLKTKSNNDVYDDNDYVDIENIDNDDDDDLFLQLKRQNGKTSQVGILRRHKITV
ncbi:hypothetical protein GQX74_012547 [Glossina fuscipes]|nr:hypothetical protein GQX74_012547 [Glossina fuscipes]